MLEYDPNAMPPDQTALATHGYILRTNEPETEARAGWADKLAGAMKDGVINALAERLALTVIGAWV